MASNYKNFVEILPEKADNWRNYCICIACKDINGLQDTLLQKFPFKAERVKNHLKKCQNFKNKYPETFAEFFTSKTESESVNSSTQNSMCSFIY